MCKINNAAYEAGAGFGLISEPEGKLLRCPGKLTALRTLLLLLSSLSKQ